MNLEDRIKMEIEALALDPFRWGLLLAVHERALAGRAAAEDFLVVRRAFGRELARDVVAMLSLPEPAPRAVDPSTDEAWDGAQAALRRAWAEAPTVVARPPVTT